MAEKVKKTAQGGQDHFGAHGAFDKETAQEVGMPQLYTPELDGYFSSLANAATTEKYILAALVKSNATLTTSNAYITTTIADLQRKLATIEKITPAENQPGKGKKPQTARRKSIIFRMIATS